MLQHLRAAVYELPFSRDEPYGNAPLEMVAELLSALELAENTHLSRGKYHWISDMYPAGDISLRTAGQRNFTLIIEEDERNRRIGEIDETSACWMTHPGAVYFHAGETYRVLDMDHSEAQIKLKHNLVDYFTEAKQNTTIEKITVLRDTNLQFGKKSFGEVLVRSQVTGYRKIDWQTRVVLQHVPLEMPVTQLTTTATWLEIKTHIVDRLKGINLWRNGRVYYGKNWSAQRSSALERDRFTCQVCGKTSQQANIHVHHREPFRNFDSSFEANRLNNLISLCSRCHARAETMVKVRSGIAGINHIFHHIAPLILMCDYSDIGVISDANSPITAGQPCVLVYDQFPAGIGLSDTLYDTLDLLIEDSFKAISSCPCQDGCPSCVGAPAENGSGAKRYSLALLKALIS